jgi:hypothetical protein
MFGHENSGRYPTCLDFFFYFIILIFHLISISDSSSLHEAKHDYLLSSCLVPRDWLFLRLRSLDAENMAVSVAGQRSLAKPSSYTFS